MVRRPNYFRRRVVVLSVVSVVAWVGVQVAPALAPRINKRLYIDAHSSVPTTVPELISSYQFPKFVCQDAISLAYSLGWNFSDLDELDYVIWRESRCMTNVHYDKDPNGGSYGLTQINGFWCERSRYYPNGYLQTQQVVSSCDDLYNPLMNLLSALEIFNYSVVHNDGNGWSPWAMPKDFCEHVHRWCTAPAIVGGVRGGRAPETVQEIRTATERLTVLQTVGRSK